MGSVFRKGGSGSGGGAAEAAARQSAEISRRIEAETRGLRTTGIGFLGQAQEPGGALPPGLTFPTQFPQVGFGGGVSIGQPPSDSGLLFRGGTPGFDMRSGFDLPQTEGRQVDFGRVRQRAQELQAVGEPRGGKAGLFLDAFRDQLRSQFPQQVPSQLEPQEQIQQRQQFIGPQIQPDIFIPQINNTTQRI